MNWINGSCVAADLLPVVFLMGPTASGKTDAAAALFEQLNCELVSVDSVQIYRGLDIGSAKPDAEFLSRYPHRLIDIRNPEETYSAANFCADARSAIDEIHGCLLYTSDAADE